ncbi:MAG: hypothetical protein K0R57_5094 [Paenibacillaceae bacterium]|nr:hypothetical protein [Paenibacillaceae bacterium]
MLTIICYYEDGKSVVTSFNGTKQEAQEYYVGQAFNLGSGGREDFQLCVRVEML